MEIWNLVFMQYEQVTLDERVDLPRPSIDTGMGLERIAAVLQGTHDNYETDLFQALIRASVEATHVPADGARGVSHRVIADHLRATSFLIADGVLPSNEGRGYVLRRIMRRGMRHAHLLGAEDPLMWRLVPALVREMGQAYPELVRAEPLITETLKLEESRFRKTLERGLKILDEETGDMSAGDSLSGDVVFKLYDTYGFPYDLTEDALRPRGIGVDKQGFDTAMERQRADARKAWSGSGDAATEDVWFGLREEAGATEFLGYEAEAAEGVVAGIVADGKQVDALAEGHEGALILNQTPFYGESGGQVGDRGTIKTPDGAVFAVSSTQKKLGDLFVHLGKLTAGALKVGDAVELEVDHAYRSGTRMHHSATHLLHEALRQTLGKHVAQKGSLVEPNRLRFDFSHPKGVGDDEIEAVERMANAVVLQNDEVSTRLMGVDEAIEAGATALFGEKYGDEVRVVTMGRQPGGGDNDAVYSMELCGGTHVQRTGDIGLIKVVSEGAVASGVRRIEALAGDEARTYLEEQDARVRQVADLLKSGPQDIAERVKALLDERKKLERELSDARKKLAMGGGTGGGDDAVSDVSGVKLMAAGAGGRQSERPARSGR